MDGDPVAEAETALEAGDRERAPALLRTRLAKAPQEEDAADLLALAAPPPAPDPEEGAREPPNPPRARAPADVRILAATMGLAAAALVALSFWNLAQFGENWPYVVPLVLPSMAIVVGLLALARGLALLRAWAWAGTLLLAGFALYSGVAHLRQGESIPAAAAASGLAVLAVGILLTRRARFTRP